MTSKSSCHLLDMLAEVPDPRNNKGKRHPLVSILALVVIGLMCGHNGYTSIATWARSQPALAKALGFTHKKTPCAATIHNLLRRLDVVALEATLGKYSHSTQTVSLENLQTYYQLEPGSYTVKVAIVLEVYTRFLMTQWLMRLMKNDMAPINKKRQ